MTDEITTEDRAIPVLRRRGRPNKACADGPVTRFPGGYGTRDYWAARFRRDYPEVALLVDGGKITAHNAATQLGLIKRRTRRKKRNAKLDAVAAMIG
jgi:hypothetical protein